MSKPRFKLYAEVDTLAHANTIKNSIQNELAGKDIFEEHNLAAYFDAESQKNLLVAELRFNNDIDRDALKHWAQDQIQNHPQVKNWVSKARIIWHRCTHDENEVSNCKVNNYGEWSK